MLMPRAIVACLLIGLGVTTTLCAAEAELAPEVRKMIEWLPADTETLMVATGDFAFTKEPADDERGLRFRQTVQQITLGHLHLLDIDEFNEGLQGAKVDLAIQGSRRFTSARGLGSWLYEGCQIIQFHESTHGTISKAFNTCQAQASATIDIRGQTVAVFDRRFEQDDWTFYLCQPQPGLLVCATNRSYLAEVLDRMQQPAKMRAFPKDLPEWKHVDVKASVWGLRHYRPDRAENAPLPLGEVDPQATGLTFWIPAAANTAEVRFLTTNKEAVEVISSSWTYPLYGMFPKVGQRVPGVVGVTCTFPTDFAEGGALLILLGYLGHGVNL